MIALGRPAEGGEDSSANRGYETLFRAARKKLRVLTPNLNDDHALDALGAATADADVELIMPKGFNESVETKWGQGGGNEHNIGRLAGRAKNVCNLHIRWFTRTPCADIEGNGDNTSHAKFAIADGQVAIVGSMNLDTQSWKKSRELTIAIDDRENAGNYDKVFDAIWATSSPAYEGPSEPGCKSSGH
jgi:phosphatidylserine/phosphatidylglycerophosphate/cardiolipin synthase-like enzyme